MLGECYYRQPRILTLTLSSERKLNFCFLNNSSGASWASCHSCYHDVTSCSTSRYPNMHGQQEQDTDTVVIPHGPSVKVAEPGTKRSPYVSRAWSVHLQPASSAYDPCSDCTNCIYGSLRCKRRKVKVRPAVSYPLRCRGSTDAEFGQCSGERPGPCQQCASSRQGCIYSQAPRKRRRVSKLSNVSKGSGSVSVAFLPPEEEAS